MRSVSNHRYEFFTTFFSVFSSMVYILIALLILLFAALNPPEPTRGWRNKHPWLPPFLQTLIRDFSFTISGTEQCSDGSKQQEERLKPRPQDRYWRCLAVPSRPCRDRVAKFELCYSLHCCHSKANAGHINYITTDSCVPVPLKRSGKRHKSDV